jgi:hypothetical protein
VRTDENEIADIQNHLRAWLADPEKFIALGKAGRKLLEDQHSPEAYAGTLIDLAVKAKAFRPRVAANRLAERSGVLLSEWLSPSQMVGDANNVASEIFELGGSVAGR